MFRRTIKAMRNPKWALFKVAKMIFKRPIPGYCAVCGNKTTLNKAGSLPTETYKCKICGAFSRVRHQAIILCRLLEIPEPYSLGKVVQSCPELKIYEAQAKGAIHDTLKPLSGYECSEFLNDVPPGSRSRMGIRCEDLQSLSFADNTFDFVITQAVFEHIRDPEAAWREVHRVLKPGGHHVFTIPYSPDQKTQRRVIPDGDQDIFVLPKIYHGDGIRDGLVYTDFGYDLPDRLNRVGLLTRVYGSDGLEGHPHHIYRGWVFVSQKRG